MFADALQHMEERLAAERKERKALELRLGDSEGFIDQLAQVSRRRDNHSAAPPSTFSRCFNSDGERASTK